MKLKHIKVWICDACLNAEGEECHTAGCMLYMNSVPGEPIREDQYELISSHQVFGKDMECRDYKA